jgi:CRP-like cAMP-binding protein
VVCLVARLERGGAAEVGIIGREGMVGLPLAFGADSSPHEALVQTPGRALRIDATVFRAELKRSPALLALLLRYECALRAQVAQTAACNGRHPLGKRLARWLLMACDRLDTNNLQLTQELLATMLGVRRASVSSAAGALQRAGILGSAKGGIAVLDRPKLEGAACECYAAIQREYEKMWLQMATEPHHTPAGPSDDTQPFVVSGRDRE